MAKIRGGSTSRSGRQQGYRNPVDIPSASTNVSNLKNKNVNTRKRRGEESDNVQQRPIR